MAARTAARDYDDFEPTMNWAREDKFDTLLIYLPGFKKDQLKVQVKSTGNLRVTGERQVSGNKWSRFQKEMPIQSNYDSNKIRAKFDNGILQVEFPKIIVTAEPRGEAKPAVQPPKPPEPTPTAEPQKMGPKQDIKEPPKAEQVPAKPTAEPQKMGPKQDIKEPPKAEQVPSKPTEEKSKPKKSTEDEKKLKEVKEESKRAHEAKTGPETALQQKSDDSAEKKATEKDQKRGDTADIGKKMEKRGTGDIGQPKAKNYKENVENLVTKLKKPRNLMNTMVAALLIVALGLYVKHAFRSIGTTEPDPEL